MKRNTGLTAVAAVALALFGVSYFPRNGPESRSPERGTAKAVSAAGTRVAPKPTVSCDDIGKRLQRFVPDLQYPQYCAESKDNHGSPKPTKSKIAIAIVPNPVSTHLPLLFDRIVEVIQQAA